MKGGFVGFENTLYEAGKAFENVRKMEEFGFKVDFNYDVISLHKVASQGQDSDWDMWENFYSFKEFNDYQETTASRL